jgi:hypothetical protein
MAGIVSVVSRLNRAAIANFSGSLLARSSKSFSIQRRSLSSSRIIRSAFASAVSRLSSPL